MAFDVAIIGGGIIGTSAAAFLAEAGQSVVLFEQAELAAGASGRNSGSLQHPYDEVLAPLHRETVELYGELAAIEPRFALGREPAGVLIVGFNQPALAALTRQLADTTPELAAQLLSPAELRATEPALADEVGAVRLATGYPVVPASATLAFARRATRAGALLRVGEAAALELSGERVRGVRLASGEVVGAGQLLVAAGPWSAQLLTGWRAEPPIRRVWGVVASVRLRHAPRQIVEEHGIDAFGGAEPSAFSLVTADGASSVGSTFLVDEPDADDWGPRLVAAGARYVPALAEARLVGVRACARPVAFDGRPLIGALPVDGLYVCAGHGPWGISTGPASARLVTAQMIARASNAETVPAALAASRWPWLS
jgi:D-hydroxyproline dehydrogenase subunit beta